MMLPLPEIATKNVKGEDMVRSTSGRNWVALYQYWVKMYISDSEHSCLGSLVYWYHGQVYIFSYFQRRYVSHHLYLQSISSNVQSNPTEFHHSFIDLDLPPLNNEHRQLLCFLNQNSLSKTLTPHPNFNRRLPPNHHRHHPHNPSMSANPAKQPSSTAGYNDIPVCLPFDPRSPSSLS